MHLLLLAAGLVQKKRPSLAPKPELKAALLPVDSVRLKMLVPPHLLAHGLVTLVCTV